MKLFRILFFVGIGLMAIAGLIYWQSAQAQSGDGEMDTGAAAHAVDLIGAWVEAGVPETDSFDYVGMDGETYQATFDADILPLFTQGGVWSEAAPPCGSCHFANTEDSFHEMNLTSYEGLLAGADVLEEPPGEPILGQTESGDFEWEESVLGKRLRDNRMPPGNPFDITEANRDGPIRMVNDIEVKAVDLIGAWVEAGAPETEAFGDYEATFETDVLPLFTQPNVWFDGSQACASCHFANTEDSYHEMNLSSYEGILAGADVLEEPPGESLLGESEPGAGDFNWEESELRHRLRDNRMPPGAVFMLDESNRDGPYVLHGEPVAVEVAEVEPFGTGECEVLSVALLDAWMEAGAPEEDAFDFVAADGTECSGNFAADVQPLFTQPGAWFSGSPACSSCHFANTENSFHEMNLSSYEGMRIGADSLEDPPGESILGESEPFAGDFDWEESVLRHRLRDNRMPPGSMFDITEANRDGPTLTVNGVEVRAVDLIGAWVEAGAPETDTFGEYEATFADNVLPLFTVEGAWFDGSPACSNCHFANTEDSYHEMNLSSYEGILAGADVLEEPPGESLLGESEPGAGDFDWEHSELRHRLRDNRMPPGSQFLIDESNRDGMLIMAGTPK